MNIPPFSLEPITRGGNPASGMRHGVRVLSLPLRRRVLAEEWSPGNINIMSNYGKYAFKRAIDIGDKL